MPTSNDTPSPDELTLSAHGHGDGIGHLFRWQGELYRAIHPEHVSLFRRLSETGVLQRLMDQGLLVGSSIVPLELPGFDLVFRHEAVPFVTYPTEWCGPMLRDAALATLDLQIALLHNNATLADAHAWNILFNGTLPVMVDLTAIAAYPDDGRWKAEGDFRFCMLYPTLLASRGRPDFGRLLTDTTTVRDIDITPLLPWTVIGRCRHLVWRGRHRLGLIPSGAGPLVRRLSGLRKRIASLRIPGDEPRQIDNSPADAWLIETVRRLSPKTAMTVDCSDGTIPHALAAAGTKVVACEADELRCAGLYRRAKDDCLDILPLVLNAEAKASTFGAFDRVPGPVSRRLSCDLVVTEINRPKRDAIIEATTSQRIDALLNFSRSSLMVRITGVADDKSMEYLTDSELEAMLRRHAAEVSVLHTDGAAVWYRCKR